MKRVLVTGLEAVKCWLRRVFVGLSLKEIGNTGFSLAVRASIVNGLPDI
jgi:hypothetical protein